MRTLGPQYGKLLGKITQKLLSMDGNAVVAAFERGESVSFDIDGAPVTLEKDDVLTESMQKPGFMAQEDRGVVVALDTNLTDELIEEGFAREMISKLQTMRKDAGFDVTDHIVITYRAGETLTAAVENRRGMVLASVLGDTLTVGEPDEGMYTREWDVNGEKAFVGIRQA